MEKFKSKITQVNLNKANIVGIRLDRFDRSAINNRANIIIHDNKDASNSFHLYIDFKTGLVIINSVKRIRKDLKQRE